MITKQYFLGVCPWSRFGHEIIIKRRDGESHVGRNYRDGKGKLSLHVMFKVLMYTAGQNCAGRAIAVGAEGAGGTVS